MQSIVLVEDSPTQAARLKKMLDEAGYLVRVAHRGQAALDLCREELPDILVSDVTMPEMDGYELCSLIKGDQDLSSIPVMLLTGLSNPKDIIYGLEAGADCYLTKPYSDEELCNRLDFVLENAKQQTHDSVEKVSPLEVTFLGQHHVITSTRRQILGLLLATYESAARRNKALDKAQLRMKMELREAKRNSEGAEAAVAIAQIEASDREEALSSIFAALPMPVFLLNEEDVVRQSDSAEEQFSNIETYSDLIESGVSFEESNFDLDGETHRLVITSPTLGNQGGAQPVILNQTALTSKLRQAYTEVISEHIHESLNELRQAIPEDAQTDEYHLALGKLETIDFLEWQSLSERVELHELDLAETVQQVLDLSWLQAAARRKKQNLCYSSTASSNRCLGDKRRLQQAILEILENSIGFGAKKSDIQVSLETDSSYHSLRIENRGTGLEENIADKATKPFVTSAPDKMGLGLAYAAEVCRGHGGELSISDKGDTVTVILKIPEL